MSEEYGYLVSILARRVQRRWICRACEREWVFVFAVYREGQLREWDEASCPVCASAAIERVEFLGVFPGADSRTEPVWPAGPDVPFAERPNLQKDRNEALLAADPYAGQLSALLGEPL
jgi:hypothetical protein